MLPLRRALTATLLTLTLLAPVVSAGQSAARPVDRGNLMTTLERLMASGEPRHIDHDEGRDLQDAVSAALAWGDRDLERLAVRAAAPLLARITSPVSPASEPPSLSIESFDVLRLPRPVPYRARIFATLDGGPETLVDTVASGRGGRGTALRTLFGEQATLPGVHTLRLRAELTFGEAWGQPAWTERRSLPTAFYALFLPDDNATAALRALVTSPASTRADVFDPALGAEPFGAWLAHLLASHGAKPGDGPSWRSEDCSARTAEAGTRTPLVSICAVAAFAVVGRTGEVWFGTAEVGETPDGADWIALSPPRFEGFVIGEAAPESETLSKLPWLLDVAPESRPVGDVAISPQDITVSTAGDATAGHFDVVVEVRNAGAGDLFKTSVSLSWATAAGARPSSRTFVVDIPAHGSARLSTAIDLPAGYGFVLAQALQVGEHAPAGHWMPDPTPEDSCAIRLVNPTMSPAGYVDALTRTAGACAVR